MSFLEGDLIYVTDGGPNEDWLQARCGKNKGLVPANYGENSENNSAQKQTVITVVGENVEQLSNPLHEAARRGNIEFLNDCIGNQVRLAESS